MKFRFRTDDGLILVKAELWGPNGSNVATLALDTGATATLISQALLIYLGYDPSLQAERAQITTGSGVEFVPKVTVEKIKTLGRNHLDFPVLSHNLPPNAGVEGLLGLDFLRGKILKVDFQKGEIELG